MGYQFTPKTEEEIEGSMALLSNGIYEFNILKSIKKISNAGNQMAELKLQVQDNEINKKVIIYDYLVFSDANLSMRKIKHFCEGVGIQEDYEKGDIREDLEGLKGYLELNIQESTVNPKGGFYPAKNIVTDYLKEEDIVKSKEDKKELEDTPF